MRAKWGLLVGVLCALLIAPAVADGNGGRLSFGPPLRIDQARLHAPAQVWAPNNVSCPSAHLCVGVGDGGQVETSVNPASPSSWTAREISPTDAIEGVSCPSASLCVAVTVRGNILTSATPEAGAWTRTAGVITDRGVSGGISCPTISLCVAVDGGSGIAVSTDPQSGVWRMIKLSGFYQLLSVSCPTASLCVSVDFDGNVVTSTDPTGGASAWKAVDLSGDPGGLGDLETVSCGTVNECVLGDDAGQVIASSQPTAGAHAWVAKSVDVNGTVFVSCLPSLQCVAADDSGNVFASTNAAAGRPWRMTTDVDPSGFAAITCQSAMLCVAADEGGSFASSSDLGALWSIGSQLGHGALRPVSLTALSCPRISLCVALDAAGNQLTSVDPGGGKWTARTINPGLDPNGLSCAARGFCEAVGPYSTVASVTNVLSAGSGWRLGDLSRYPPGSADDPTDELLNAVSCVSSSLCVATRDDATAGNFNLEVSRNPAGPPTSWHAIAIGEPEMEDFTGISCPAVKLCVAADENGGQVAVSTDGAARWRLVQIADVNAGILDVSCPSQSFCAAVSDGGQVITSTFPSGGPDAWQRTAIDRGHDLDAIACASRSLCMTFDSKGRVFVSTDPTDGAATWHATATGQDLTNVACPSNHLCVLTTSAGSVLVATRRPHA